MLNPWNWVNSVLAEDQKSTEAVSGISAEQYAEWEKVFGKAKFKMFWGFVLTMTTFSITVYWFWSSGVWEMGVVQFAKKYPYSWIFLLPFWISRMICSEGVSVLKGLLLEFVKASKIQKVADDLRDASRSKISPHPDLPVFASFRSLRAFEEHYVKLYSDRRKKLIKQRHLENERNKNAERVSKLEQELKDLNFLVEEALVKLENEQELEYYKERFARASNAKTVRDLLQEIDRKSKNEQEIASRQASKVKTLLSSLLQDARVYGLCSDAEKYIADASNSPNDKQKISCLKSAISAQRDFNKKKEFEVESETEEG